MEGPIGATSRGNAYFNAVHPEEQAEDSPTTETYVLTECDEDELCEMDEEDSSLVPSKVTSKDYIHFPEERDSENGGGKWLLFSHGDFDLLDSFWTRLRPLVPGVVTGLKCSTATDPVTGVLMAYTEDSEDRAAVKRAADAIRGVVQTDYVLVYKTNEASDAGQYLKHGDTHITKYMHTVAGTLYERDRNNRWVKVTTG